MVIEIWAKRTYDYRYDHPVKDLIAMHIGPGFQNNSYPGPGPILADGSQGLGKPLFQKHPSDNGAREDTGTGSETPRAPGNTTGSDGSAFQNPLNQAELKLVSELKKIDQEVRNHEMAHVSAAGGLAVSGANFTFRRGPDGKNYAVAGEVSIDASPVPGDPEATIRKMKKVKTAALAPTNPSAQDVKVAARASSEATKALSELMILQSKERASNNKDKAFGSLEQASASYIRVNGLPEKESHSFELAV